MEKSAIDKHVECYNHRYQSAKIAENSIITNAVKFFYHKHKLSQISGEYICYILPNFKIMW